MEERPLLAGCSSADETSAETRRSLLSADWTTLGRVALNLPRYSRLLRHHQEVLQKSSNASLVLERLALLPNHSFI